MKGFNKYNKYKNIKVKYDNIIFSSKKERDKYIELKLLEKQGLIMNLRLQPIYELQPKFKKNGKTYRAIKYIADFEYYDLENHKGMVIDVKASKLFVTDIYKLKRKMFEYKYPDLTITELY